MRRYSVVDFEGSIYALGGVADEYALKVFKPIDDMLHTLEQNEELRVYVTIYNYKDDSGMSGDLTDDEVMAVAGRTDALLASGDIEIIESRKFVFNGLLDVPFEDYYNLEGQARFAYLAARQVAKNATAALIAKCKSENMSDDEIEQFIRNSLLHKA